ncbi:MAG TPA: hypothetical protein VMU08_15775 [Rhizomicrobium sp.]|nr:hypothetical protein [Rhizomicrobium sp.]
MKQLLAASTVAVLVSSPALADCAGSHALDRCLVGTWSYASGGSAEWLNRNVRMAHVTSVTHSGLSITFRPDGTFSTGHVDINAHVAANNGAMTGSSHSTGQASGTWSAAGGRFTLCMTPGALHTTVTVVVHGRPITVTPAMPPHPVPTAYTCSAASLTTTQPIPGHEPIVTAYSRAH